MCHFGFKSGSNYRFGTEIRRSRWGRRRHLASDTPLRSDTRAYRQLRVTHTVSSGVPRSDDTRKETRFLLYLSCTSVRTSQVHICTHQEQHTRLCSHSACCTPLRGTSASSELFNGLFKFNFIRLYHTE